MLERDQVAVVHVSSSEGSSEIPLRDLLAAYAQDREVFERLGALRVNQTIEVDEHTKLRRVT